MGKICFDRDKENQQHIMTGLGIGLYGSVTFFPGVRFRDASSDVTLLTTAESRRQTRFSPPNAAAITLST